MKLCQTFGVCKGNYEISSVLLRWSKIDLTSFIAIPGLTLGSSSMGNNNVGSNSASPVGSLSSVSPSSAHFPDSIKDDWDSDNPNDDEESKCYLITLSV